MLDLETIKLALENHKPKKLPLNEQIPGAVLVPIFENKNELYLLLTKRTEQMPTHKGQISFPGGRKEEKDKTLVDCALRETREEIGLVSSEIQIIGELDSIRTHTSNFLLAPFVGLLNYPFVLNINKEEVEEVIEIPLEEFFTLDNWESSDVEIDSGIHTIWFFTYKKWVVWGATAKIIKHFVSMFELD
ncbi:MAG: CoA pyrophosphatase [Candidatus Heimdallarchaeota archaeon]